jgi:hypothetical protein
MLELSCRFWKRYAGKWVGMTCMTKLDLGLGTIHEIEV